MNEYSFDSNDKFILYNNVWIKVKYLITIAIVTTDRYKYKVFK